jgi:hypothetical protein
MGIVERIDHRHRPGQGPFDRLVRELAQVLRIVNENRFLTRHPPRSARSHHSDCECAPSAVFKIHAAEVFNKGGDKVLAGLLAVADNINTRAELFVEDKRRASCLPAINSSSCNFHGDHSVSGCASQDGR